MKLLVVGTGLAGLSIAERILEAGHKLTVICNLNKASSTDVATGMYNPIVFRHLNKSWMVDELTPVIHDFFSKLELKLNVTIDTPIKFFKKFPNEDYKNWWIKRQEDAEHKDYFGPIKDNHGEILNAGLIDCKNLKAAYEEYLLNEQLLINEDFDYLSMIQKENGIVYQDEFYDKVILCEGPYAAQNKLWSWLPFNICKGEWITVESETEVCDYVLNAVTNVIPLGEKKFKLSSTFSWEPLDWKTTETARTSLSNDFKSLFDSSFKVIDQQAALRPTVADRRPYLGEHPEFKNLYIFNGLGSKGVMLAPFFSKHLLEHIAEGKPLLSEVDIIRHKKRFINRNIDESSLDKNH